MNLLLFSLLTRRDIFAHAALAASVPNGPDIYFYSEVTPESCLQLTKAVREKSAVCVSAQNKFGLESPPPISLHIQSRGGSLFPAFHVCDLLGACNVHTHIEGMVASSACGKRRFMTQHSFMLLHEPSIVVSEGKYSDIALEKANMDTIFNAMIEVYERHSALTRDQVRRLLFAERYLSSQECLEYGLVDEIL